MRITLLVGLLLLGTFYLAAQKDLRYFRGVSFSIELGLPGAPENTFYPLSRITDPDVIAGIPRRNNRLFQTLIIAPKDTNYYYFQQGTTFKSRVTELSQRYNLQLRLEKKRRSGFEYGGGLFFSAGTFNTRPLELSTELEDFAISANTIEYQRIGVSGSLKFDVFRDHRLQPSIGIQALFLNERVEVKERRTLVPAYQLELEMSNDNPAVDHNFILDARILAGLAYPLSEKILLALNASVLTLEAPWYAGLQLKYRLTRY